MYRKEEKFKVFLIRYNRCLTIEQSSCREESKIFFDYENLKRFVENNFLYSAVIEVIEVEDVKSLNYELL